MFKVIWEVIKAPFRWVKNGWMWFEGKVAGMAPGLKTRIAAGLGSLGSLAASMQEYMTGLPLDKFITGTQIAITTAVLFTLVFWFRRLADTNT